MSHLDTVSPLDEESDRPGAKPKKKKHSGERRPPSRREDDAKRARELEEYLRRQRFSTRRS